MEDLWWEFWERESESMLLTVLFLIAYLSPQSLVIVTMYHVSLFTVGDQAVTRALCVTASGRGRPDNNRLFHYLLQPFPGLWALTTGQSRDTDIGGHYLGPDLISGWLHVLTPLLWPWPGLWLCPLPVSLCCPPSHTGLTPSHLSGRLMSFWSWGILSLE